GSATSNVSASAVSRAGRCVCHHATSAAATARTPKSCAARRGNSEVLGAGPRSSADGVGLGRLVLRFAMPFDYHAVGPRGQSDETLPTSAGPDDIDVHA